MKYCSTRGGTPTITASVAIQKGLADDGGLFVPARWPSVSISEKDSQRSFPQFAAQLLGYFFAEDTLSKHLSAICENAFNFPVPLKHIKEGTAVLELFHGPTLAFKDFGARFLANCLGRLPSPTGASQLVMVATSGDTGGAVASAFCSLSKIPVCILYPDGKISARQEKQLTVWGPQVRALAVKGSFDDCQDLVKAAFMASAWNSRFHLISANSINIARLLPQMCYFAYASLQYLRDHGRPAGLIIPSGNVGNATAALWALRLGYPIKKVIFAHNSNHAVPDFLKTGDWRPHPSIATLANAMDVGNPSNFERVRTLYPSLDELQKHMSAFSVSDQQISEQIKKGLTVWGQIWCPHTAVAVQIRELQADKDWIIVSTAHPAKFEKIVEPLIGQAVPVPQELADLLNLKSEKKVVSPRLEELEKVLF